MVEMKWNGDMKKYVEIEEKDRYRWEERGGKENIRNMEEENKEKEVKMI